MLYNFAGLPQTLLLNPGLETNYKYHFGVPLFSGFSSEIAVTGAVISDVFVPDGRDINDKMASVLKNLDARDYAKLNSQIEVINAGFRIAKKAYVSLGFYQEFDAIGYFPKDIVTFANEGNAAYINRNFSASQIITKLDVF